MAKWKFQKGLHDTSWFELRERGARIRIEFALESPSKKWKASADNVPGMRADDFPKYFASLDEAKSHMEDWFFESLWRAQFSS